MALTADEIRERIAALEVGVGKIESGVTFADRGVTYVSIESLRDRIAYYQELLRNLLGRRSRQTMLVSSKGF